MKIYYSKKFLKQFSKYNKQLQKRIYSSIQSLPSGDVKKLNSNIENLYRLRISKYRVIFQMYKNEIKILKIDSRGDIYKKNYKKGDKKIF